jgi:hypothetical protein
MLAVSVLAVGFAACGGDDDDDSAGATTTGATGEAAGDFTPREEGKLIVGTELPAPPLDR